MGSTKLHFAFALCVCLLGVECSAATFEILGGVDPGYQNSILVSDDGNTVLSRRTGSGYLEPFIWKRTDGIVERFSRYNFHSPTAMSGDGTRFLYGARDASYDGRVVVGAANNQALRSDGNGTVFLGDLPGGQNLSIAEAVSADGTTVVGISSAADGIGVYLLQPFRWTLDEGMTPLGMLPGANRPGGYASDVSGDGSTIVGWSEGTVPPGHYEAFRWTAADGMQGLGDLPGGRTSSAAYAISADGLTIVGESVVSSCCVTEAMVWTESQGMRSLPQMLVEEYGSDLTDLRLVSATGVSANGRVIIGWGTQTSAGGSVDSIAWRVDLGPIPEPMTLPLSLGSLFFFAMADFRRRRKPSTARHC